MKKKNKTKKVTWQAKNHLANKQKFTWRRRISPDKQEHSAELRLLPLLRLHPHLTCWWGKKSLEILVRKKIIKHAGEKYFWFNFGGCRWWWWCILAGPCLSFNQKVYICFVSRCRWWTALTLLSRPWRKVLPAIQTVPPCTNPLASCKMSQILPILPNSKFSSKAFKSV